MATSAMHDDGEGSASDNREGSETVVETSCTSNEEQEVRRVSKVFPLFELPAELWIHICRLAASDDILLGQEADRETMSTATGFQAFVCQPAITRTCRRVRRESLDVFYSNRFVYYAHSGYAARRVEGHFLRWSRRMLIRESRIMPNVTIEICEGMVEERLDSWADIYGLSLQLIGGFLCGDVPSDFAIFKVERRVSAMRDH
ncbi:hypothetical protein LTR53_009022 [Teratosphaeriaceae sp. CCFEE 6253]|nr:hypothetical protein LTR53_009022 [Teratosphaeriaceae sp. CCFEE 6253]